jgi:GNAT superfamily N-acetyltransferase
MLITVRKALHSDIAGLDDLFTQVDMLHHDGLPEIFREPSTPARSDNLVDEWLKESSTVVLLVAEIDKEIVGFLHAFIRHPPEFPLFEERVYLQIDSLVVAQTLRMHGIGSMLLSEVEAWARSRGVNRIELNVFDFNRIAISFYRKHGFGDLSHKMYKDLPDDKRRAKGADA